MNVNITVVVPTYKRPLLLDRCLDALLTQAFSKDQYEVIVVTDGPDAESERIISKWKTGNQLSLLSLPKKAGPAAARNLGWKAAKGKLVLFTDDDCIPDQHWMEAYWSAYRGEELLALRGTVIVPVKSPPTDFEKNTQGLESAPFITANCACTFGALCATGGFDEQFTMAWREDSDLEFKLLSLDIPIRKIPAAVVTHPVRKTRWGISIWEQKKGLFNALLYKKFPDLYRQKIQPQPAWNYLCIICSFVAMLVGLLTGAEQIALAFLLAWVVLNLLFIHRRLSGTSHSLKHVVEMVITSLIIPFLSIYWQLYGAIKYRVIFL